MNDSWDGQSDGLLGDVGWSFGDRVMPNPEYEEPLTTETNQEFAKAKLEMQDDGFARKYLHFHFGTLPPIAPTRHYDRVKFRYPVPLLDSLYSLQASTLYSLQWPKGLGISSDNNCDKCPKLGEKYCESEDRDRTAEEGGWGGCSCAPGCLGTCTPKL